MRITGGTHRGRVLISPKGQAVRPTSDKIRQSIFNMLRGEGLIEDARILDLFCGTGALGLEALSQGAKYCLFVDSAKTSINLAKQNAKALNLEGQTEFLLKDAAKINLAEPVDLVFMDPPYHKNLAQKAIENLSKSAAISGETFFVIETEKNASIDNLKIESQKIYGDTMITLGRIKIYPGVSE